MSPKKESESLRNAATCHGYGAGGQVLLSRVASCITHAAEGGGYILRETFQHSLCPVEKDEEPLTDTHKWMQTHTKSALWGPAWNPTQSPLLPKESCEKSDPGAQPIGKHITAPPGPGQPSRGDVGDAG